MKKAFLIALAILTLLIATSCGTTNDVDNDGDTSSKQIKETTPATIEYALSENATLQDISFKYDKSWEMSIDTDNISFLIDEPFVMIDMMFVEYDDSIIEANDLLEIYTEPSDNETLIDTKSFCINGSEPAVRVKLKVDEEDADRKYREIIAFNCNSNIYSLYIYADIGYQDNCNNIMTDILETISFNESETTAEPMTVEPTEPPTEKPTEITDSYTKLYSDDNISLYYCSTNKYDYDDDEAIVNFYVENYTDKILTISSGLFVLDGITYNDGTMSDEIVGKTKGYIDAHINDINNFTPSTIGLSFTYYEQYNYDSKNRIEVKETKIE